MYFSRISEYFKYNSNLLFYLSLILYTVELSSFGVFDTSETNE